MRRLGRRPPTEVEAMYYAQIWVGQHTDHTQQGVHETWDPSDRVVHAAADQLEESDEIWS
jgi:hypothetical protein